MSTHIKYFNDRPIYNKMTVDLNLTKVNELRPNRFCQEY